MSVVFPSFILVLSCSTGHTLFECNFLPVNQWALSVNNSDILFEVHYPWFLHAFYFHLMMRLLNPTYVEFQVRIGRTKTRRSFARQSNSTESSIVSEFLMSLFEVLGLLVFYLTFLKFQSQLWNKDPKWGFTSTLSFNNCVTAILRLMLWCTIDFFYLSELDTPPMKKSMCFAISIMNY